MRKLSIANQQTFFDGVQIGARFECVSYDMAEVQFLANRAGWRVKRIRPMIYEIYTKNDLPIEN